MLFRPTRRKKWHRKSETKLHLRTDTVSGVDGKYIQWNEILRDILVGKLKIFQNRTRKYESESESEEGVIDEESDCEMEYPDTSEKVQADQHKHGRRAESTH